MDLTQWLDQQRRKSKQVNDKVDAALDFMRHQYGSNERKILNEIRCIDFSKDVKGVSIAKRTILVGYKDPRVSPYKSSYFTRSGNSADRLGVSTVGRPAHYDHTKKKVTTVFLHRDCRCSSQKPWRIQFPTLIASMEGQACRRAPRIADDGTRL